MLTGIGLWLPVTRPGLRLEVSFVQTGPSPYSGPSALAPGPSVQGGQRAQTLGMGTAARLEGGSSPTDADPILDAEDSRVRGPWAEHLGLRLGVLHGGRSGLPLLPLELGRVPFPQTLLCLPSPPAAARGIEPVWEGRAKKVLESGHGQNS